MCNQFVVLETTLSVCVMHILILCMVPDLALGVLVYLEGGVRVCGDAVSL